MVRAMDRPHAAPEDAGGARDAAPARAQRSGPEPLTRAEAIGVAALFAVALGLRWVHTSQLLAHDPFFHAPAVDGGMYHAWAQRIAAGDWLGEGVFQNGPAYPYLLAATYALAGPSLLAAKLAQNLMGALVCVGVWWLGRRLFDARVAWIAGAATASYEMLVFFEGLLVVANLLVLLTVAALVAVVRARERPTSRRWLLAGLVAGLAVLARPTALVFAALVATGLVLGIVLPAARRRRLVLALAFAGGVAAAVLPVTLRNLAVAGDFVLVTAAGGLNLYTGNHPHANGMFRVPPQFPRHLADDAEAQRAAFREAAERAEGRRLRPSEVSDFWARQSLAWMRAEPAAFARLLGRKLALSVSAYEAWNIRSITLSRDFSGVLRLPLLDFGILAPLGLAGMIFALRDWRRLLPLYAMLASVWAGLLVFFVLARYRLPAVPVLALFAGFACVAGFDAWRARRPRRLLALGAAIGACALAVHATAPREALSVAYYNLGNRYLQRGDFEQALGSYRESIRRNPGYLSAWNNLARAYEQSGVHPEEAIRAWQHVLEVGRREGLPRYVERAQRHLRALRSGGSAGGGGEGDAGQPDAAGRDPDG